jgi:hypothetical protein
MTKIDILSVTGVSTPFNVFICDAYGNQCVLISTVNTVIPPEIPIILPFQFNTAPAIGLKIIDNFGCEKFEIINC